MNHDISQFEISCYDIRDKKSENYYVVIWGMILFGIIVIAGMYGLLD